MQVCQFGSLKMSIETNVHFRSCRPLVLLNWYIKNILFFTSYIYMYCTFCNTVVVSLYLILVEPLVLALKHAEAVRH